MKTLLMVALIVTGALAAGQGNRMMTFTGFDSNNDGKITQIEFENTQQEKMTAQAEAGRMMRNAGNAPQFNTIDTNNDGNIDTKEFSAHQSMMRSNRGNAQGMGQNR